MAGGPISWSLKQQGVVALSSCEAEYVVCTHVAKELLWLRSFTHELGFIQPAATPIFCDNQGAVACAQDPQHHTRMKHIAIRYHFIRNCVSLRTLDVMHIPGIENVADLLTKPLHRLIHKKWVDLLRLALSPGGVLDMDDQARPG
jgi:hypothetical protein